MRATLGFVKSTLIGGIVFLLPIGIVVIVLGKLLGYSRRIGDAAHARLFPGADSDFVPMLIAACVLVATAFAAGAFARTRLGLRIFSWLEGLILARVPAYTILRQTIGDMAGGAEHLSGASAASVVHVRFDDYSALGFLIERRPDDTAIVFLPGAPSALTGTVVQVDADRLIDTALSPADVVQGMRRLGAGVASSSEPR
jgi:uncharacterized membrane protein